MSSPGQGGPAKPRAAATLELTAAQRACVEGLAQNRCVTSGAGCGKTRVLVERYMQFLREVPDLALERLAAITFTENAAAEMRERIRAACRQEVEAARAARDPVRVRRWLQRYWDVDVAPINTIHGFCASLLRQFPIEAGTDPNFAVLDEATAALLAEETAGTVIERLLEADDADLERVLDHFDLVELRATLAEMLRQHREALRRVADPALARSDEEVLTGLRRALGERARQAYRRVLERPEIAQAVRVLEGSAGRAEDRTEQARAAALEALGRLGPARTADLAAQAAADIASANLRGGSPRAWPSKEQWDAVKAAIGAVRDAFEDVQKRLPPFDPDREAEHLALARALWRTIGRAIEAYQEAKRDRSALDFEDLQMRARDLLRGDKRVLAALQKRCRAVLVDELQDTNFLQFEIIDLVASGSGRRRPRASPPSDASPSGTALRPGALFAVGDPKQSIYRFRGAQVEVFDAALARVGPAGRKDLPESWRLHPGTAALVNHLFEPLLGPTYERIEGRRPQVNEAVGEILVVADPRRPDGFRADEGHAEEARALAARIEDLVAGKQVKVHDPSLGCHGCAAAVPAPSKDARLRLRRRRGTRPARYGDVAILLRRTSFLHVYEEALERQGVPYYVVAGGGFYKQQEVLDVLHVLRVLDDPSDDLHLAGVLRSPLFSVSDEGLYRLRGLGRPLWGVLGRAAEVARLDDEDRRGLERAARRLPEWQALKDRLGLAALLDRVIFESGYAASAVGRFGGTRAYANLRQMAELARAFEAQGLHALGDYIEYVTDFVRSAMRQEQAPVEEPTSDAVRIMTIHKAKGLEFPIVVVPDLVFGPQRPSGDPCLVHATTGLAVRMRGPDGDGGPCAALAVAQLDAAQAEEAESRRLLYVVTTRAKDYLVFASHLRYKPSREGTWHDLLLKGLGADLAEGGRLLSLPGGPMLRLTVVPPLDERARRDKRRVGPRDIFTAGRVAWDRLRERGRAAPERGVAGHLRTCAPPPPAGHVPARITATALNAYDRCPALYWWRHVAGLEEGDPPEARSEGALSPRQVGRVLHRALELARSPHETDVRAAVEGAVRELADAPGRARPGLRLQVAEALRAFWASDLGRRVARGRRVLRELPMLLAVDGVEIAAAVDLLFEDADGGWELVDYKSGTPDAGRAPDAASAFRLQLGLYALAASRWLDRPLDRRSVYFLGSAVTHTHDLAGRDLEEAEALAKRALSGLAAGQFEPRRGRACSACAMRQVCPGR